MIRFNRSRKTGRRYLFILLCLANQLVSTAQEIYTFKEGMIANIPHRYGREALYTDELAYQLYTNTLKASPACLPGTIESDHVLIFVIIGIVWDYLCLHQPDSFNDPVAEITSLQLALLNGRPVMNAAIQP